MESREDFYFDDSDNPGSDDTIEKEEHYKWKIELEEEIKEDAVIPEEDLLEQAEPEVAERLILKRDLRKAAIAKMEAAARTQGDFEDVIDAEIKRTKTVKDVSVITRSAILRKIHKKLIPILQYKCDNGLSTTMKERNFLERHCSTDG